MKRFKAEHAYFAFMIRKVIFIIFSIHTTFQSTINILHVQNKHLQRSPHFVPNI